MQLKEEAENQQPLHTHMNLGDKASPSDDIKQYGSTDKPLLLVDQHSESTKSINHNQIEQILIPNRRQPRLIPDDTGKGAVCLAVDNDVNYYIDLSDLGIQHFSINPYINTDYFTSENFIDIPHFEKDPISKHEPIAAHQFYTAVSNIFHKMYIVEDLKETKPDWKNEDLFITLGFVTNSLRQFTDIESQPFTSLLNTFLWQSYQDIIKQNYNIISFWLRCAGITQFSNGPGAIITAFCLIKNKEILYQCMKVCKKRNDF